MTKKTIYTIATIVALGLVVYVSARIVFAEDGPCSPKAVEARP